MLQSQSQPPKLLDQVRTAIRTRHYSIRTEATYLSWIPRSRGEVEPHDFSSRGEAR